MKNFLPLIILLFFVIISCKKSEKSTEMTEKYRPQVHFSPKAHWMNDPNGMVYFEGEYHMFFQHYPDSTVWGPMHWGHAVSTDLMHWEELPIALYPDSLGWIFSGSAVIDWQNTSKLGSKDKPAMIAIFTYHNEKKAKAGQIDFQSQGLAYSLDKGRTWTKYAKNPVLPNPGIKDFRDPKVSWSEIHKKWIMILAVVDHTNIYSSTDLLSWKFESEFGRTLGAHGGVWECPDLFPIVSSKNKTTKWAMLVSINPGAPNGGSGTQYFIGEFDGKTFTTDKNESKWLDYGKDNYAGVTWADVPAADGRRLFLGWMNNWQYADKIPTTTWRGATTIAKSLELKDSKTGYILTSNPVKEIELLESKMLVKESVKVKSKTDTDINLAEPMDIEFVFEKSNTLPENFGIILSNSKNEEVKIGYDSKKKYFYVDNTKNGWQSPNKDFAIVSYAPYVIENESIKFRLIIDKSSIEFFAQDGEIVMTHQFFPTEPFSKIETFSEKEEILVHHILAKTLKSIWD
jgi:fructan beta-fructosidase